MTLTYKLAGKHPDNAPDGVAGKDIDTMIFRKSDGAIIPTDNSNKDYQEYLEWVAEGNTIEAAD